MRREDRAVNDFSRQLEILRDCRVLHLALTDEAGLYSLPLSFGFVREGEKLTLYIHSAPAGRKVAAMTRGCPVAFSMAFSMACGVELLPGATPCQTSCRYRSLTGTGYASPVEDPAEKCRALSAILAHQTGETVVFTEAMAQSVAVFRIRVDSLSGKARQ